MDIEGQRDGPGATPAAGLKRGTSLLSTPAEIQIAELAEKVRLLEGSFQYREQALADAIGRIELYLGVFALLFTLIGVAVAILGIWMSSNAARYATEAYFNKNGQDILGDLASPLLREWDKQAHAKIEQLDAAIRRRGG